MTRPLIVIFKGYLFAFHEIWLPIFEFTKQDLKDKIYNSEAIIYVSILYLD